MLIERFVGWMETAPSEKRAAATNALARAWLLSPLGSEERESAEATLTFLLDDPEPEVRLAMAKALCASSHAPRHIILSLSQDEDRIAIPVLAASPVLLDAELVATVIDGQDEHQVAVACRPVVRPAVCKTIAELGCEAACLAMVLNPNSAPSKDDFFVIAKRFGGEEDLRRAMLERPDIGMRARLKLIEKYAISLLDSDETEKLAYPRLKREIEMREVCDKAAITYAAQAGEAEIFEIVDALIAEKRLTTAFLLRALCMGNISLFASALARLSGQPVARVERILIDNRRTAFEAVYTKAGLPASARPVFATAVSCWRSALERLDDTDQARLPYMVTREILMVHRPGSNGANEDLLMLLGRICTETARDHARSHVRQLALGYAWREQELLLHQQAASEADHIADEEDAVSEVEADHEDADIALAASEEASPANGIELSEEDMALFQAVFEEEMARSFEADSQRLEEAEAVLEKETANTDLEMLVVDEDDSLDFSTFADELEAWCVAPDNRNAA